MEASALLTHTTHNRNRVKIQKICPIIPKNELFFNDKNAILGISIGSSSILGNKATSIFNFLNKRGMNRINLLIGDSLYRHTAVIKNKCDEQEGIEIANNETNNLLQYYQTHVNCVNPSYQLNFILASDIQKNKDFINIYENLLELFRKNNIFKNVVDNFSNFYLSRVLDVIDNCSKEKFKQYSYQYLLEELAIFAILNQQGMNILIYPGDIQTIYDIITMDEPYLSGLFKNYMFVSLRIKRS